jgi:predicted Zn-dependent peptidase
METRTNQNACYNALVQYGIYGEESPVKDVVTIDELRSATANVYIDLLKALNGMKHTVLYWGPADMNELSAIISKNHKTVKALADVPKNKVREKKITTDTEILVAPYDAKNINMRMVHSEGKKLDVGNVPVVKLFNEYFGGSMNAIVFQELREARGLAYNAWAAYVTPNRKEEKEYYQEHIISQNDKMMDCIRVFNEITDTLPQSETLFNTAKQSIMKTIAAQRTTRIGILSSYLRAQYLGIDYDVNKLIYEKVPNLTLNDILKFEQDNIKGKPLRYMILGNEEELDMQSLQKMGQVRRLTLDDIFPSYK